MGFFDTLFGSRNRIPTVTTILPDAAKQEIIAGRLPILRTDKLFLKRGEKIHFIDKAVNMEQKTVKEFRHVGSSAPGLFKGTRWSSGRGRTIEHTELVQHRGILYICFISHTTFNFIRIFAFWYFRNSIVSEFGSG